MSNTPFNPLDKSNLGVSIGNALLDQKPQSLGSLKRFSGAGIYAIYYQGDFEPYSMLSGVNRQESCARPIYVGKAVPSGARKGASELTTSKTNALFSRLTKHAATVEQATNLSIDDFLCKFLVVDDIWIPLGESLMIARYSPLWNKCLDGFGNNDPGSGRYKQLRSKWDVLHPGRHWAERCEARPETEIQLAEEVREFLKHFC